MEALTTKQLNETRIRKALKKSVHGAGHHCQNLARIDFLLL